MRDTDQLAFKNLFEVVAWLIATSGCLYTLHYTVTRQFTDVGPGMYPASFLLLCVSFIALNLRYFRLAPQSVRAIEPSLSRALLAVLCIVITLRVVEGVAGVPLPMISFLLGDPFSGGAYTSWGTATGILLLFAIATLIPDQPRPGFFWVSYAAYWLVMVLCAHQLLHWSGMGVLGFELPGVSTQSAIALLCLAGVVLPRSPFWPALFDTRTPRSNTTVVGSMLLALGAVVAEASMMKHLGPLEALTYAVLLSLPVLARVLRGKEIAALIAKGALTKAGKLRPVKIVPDMRPLPDEQRSFWRQLIFDYAFVKPVWVQATVHVIVTAALASVSIMFSSVGDESFATIWPVNAFLCYWLIINPVSRWPQVVGYFYMSLLSVNLAAGTTLQSSAMLGGLNAVEGLTLALLIRQTLGLRVQNRRVQIRTLRLSKILLVVTACLIALVGTSLVGGAIITYTFGGDVLPNAWVWYFASAAGAAMIGPIALGFLMEVHWGFPPLQSAMRRSWLVSLVSWIAFWAVLPFAANFALGMPVMAYVVFAGLGLLFPSLWRAGVHFTVVSLLFLTFRKLNPDALPLIAPTFLAVQLLLMSIIVAVFVVRNQQERAQRELDLIATEGPSNVVTLDHNGAIVTCTEHLSRMTGTDKAQLIGENLFDMLQVEATDDSELRIPALGAERWRVSIPQSSVRAVDIVTKRVADPTMPFAFICAVRDQTEALEAEEARIAQIERSKTLVISQDADWKIIHCSDGWCDTMGYTREETVGRDILDFFASDTEATLNAQRRGATPAEVGLRDVDAQNFQYGLRTKSGDIRVITFKSTYIDLHPAVNVATLEDITAELEQRAEKERAYAELKEQTLTLERSLKEQKRLEETAKTYLEVSEGLSTIQNEDFEIIQMSQPLLDLLGYDTVDDLPPVLKLRADGIEHVLKRRPEILALPTGVSFEPYQMSFRTMAGETKTFQLRCKWLPTVDGKSRFLATNLEDVTRLQEQAEVLARQAKALELQAEELERNLEQQKRLEETAKYYLEAGQGLFAIQNEHFEVIQMSQKFLDTLGYARPEDVPPVTKLRTDRENDIVAYRATLLDLPIGASIPATRMNIRARNGELLTFQARAKWFPTTDGKSRILVNTFEDITQLQEQAEALERQAETDPLTGVLNRLGLEKCLDDVQSPARQHGWTLCLVDIDWFKSVNDTYSHRVGDELLKAVAKTLQAVVPEHGLVGRLGGEEFLVAAPWTSEDQAHALGEQVRQEIGKVAVQSDGHIVSRTASIGVARLTTDDSLSNALNIADIALSEAKETGRNTIVLADHAFIEDQLHEGAFVTELEIAAGIENGEFVYYVQPIYNTHDNKVAGFEALIRWRQADGSVWLPDIFVERFQRIFYRPEYLQTRQAMRHAVLQGLSTGPDTYVSWNLELQQFAIDSFVTDVIRTANELQKTAPHALVLEISEAQITDRANFEAIIPNLQKLRDAGIKIALDDFGSKQSNINRLAQLPVDIVKLDKSLIDNIEHSSRAYATLRGIARLLEELDIEVIAEGVETLGQARRLTALNIYKHQGYLYGKPMPPTEVQSIEAECGNASDAAQ
ncbi:MAG: EAL domain-containing protein [Rhodobacteraceae bacterium]|nr:EAL domain-containing protein [Paracoccaceae bacterium]